MLNLINSMFDYIVTILLDWKHKNLHSVSIYHGAVRSVWSVKGCVCESHLMDYCNGVYVVYQHPPAVFQCLCSYIFLHSFSVSFIVVLIGSD